MFKKAVKIKSNTQVKGSERKTFKDLLLNKFSKLSVDDVNALLPKKEVLNIIKLITHNNDIVHVYTIQKRAMVFEFRGTIYPTVFLLWKFPDMVHTFVTHQQVMSNISSGADLMLPGVLTPSSQTGSSKYGSVSEKEVVCISLSDNKAAIAVGVAAQSSGAMAMSNSRGKCAIIHHFYGDSLCTLEGMPNAPLPNFGRPDWLLKISRFEEDFPALPGTAKKEETRVNDEVPLLEEPLQNDVVDEKINKEELLESDDFDMDELLCYCFFGALKYSKKLTLPALTSSFYKLHMLPMTPEGQILDLKKTTYKKLKTFLEKMSEEGIIKLQELKKGVETISSVNQNHPRLAEFYVNPENRPIAKTDEASNQSLDVIESYVITQNVLPIFQFEGYCKGDIVQGPVIKKCVTKYVKDKNIQDQNNPRLVKLDETLSFICKSSGAITWEEIIEKVSDAMKNCFKVKSGNEELWNKGKVTPITMNVSVRSGNKKVTLIDNLELYGIRIAELAKECQHGVAASTSISRPPGKKSDQLLVQGNQVVFVYNLLTEKYKIPKRFVKGLENAPKKKK